MNFKELSIKIAEQDDQPAFEALFRHFYAGLLSFTTSVIKDRQLAEEVVEDVFVKLWEHRQTLPTITNLPHYIYVAAKHAAINCIKKRKRETAPLTPVFEEQYTFLFTNDGATLISRENLQHINDAINSLPARCRLIFRLIKTEGLSYMQTAALLNLSVKTVEAQMAIAIKKLATRLATELKEYDQYFNKKKQVKNYPAH